jgi:hypothetical protein
MTGIGPVTVRQPRVRDRAGDAGERIRFSPNILPRYARRTKSVTHRHQFSFRQEAGKHFLGKRLIINPQELIFTSG